MEEYIIERTENSTTWDYGVPVENYDEWLSGYTNTNTYTDTDTDTGTNTNTNTNTYTNTNTNLDPNLDP